MPKIWTSKRLNMTDLGISGAYCFSFRMSPRRPPHDHASLKQFPFAAFLWQLFSSTSLDVDKCPTVFKIDWHSSYGRWLLSDPTTVWALATTGDLKKMRKGIWCTKNVWPHPKGLWTYSVCTTSNLTLTCPGFGYYFLAPTRGEGTRTSERSTVNW